ncbi:hypothetical protein HYS92_00895 [Candidatus Daviesbacteria bacterium]|nr:hypothetical protein [Candidatus Daviesbacteria bacterium]
MRYLAQTGIWQLDQVVGVRTFDGEDTSSKVLGRFKQIFPLTLFPDQLIIEQLRVIWMKNYGLWADEVISIMATDIACVDASAGPFFGHIHVKSLTGGFDIFVDKLFRRDVYQIRNLIESIALSARAGIKFGDEVEADGQRIGFPQQGSNRMN